MPAALMPKYNSLAVPMSCSSRFFLRQPRALRRRADSQESNAGLPDAIKVTFMPSLFAYRWGNWRASMRSSSNRANHVLEASAATVETGVVRG